MGLFDKLLGRSERPLNSDEWEGYSVNFTDRMPDPGVYLDLDANVMSLVIEVGGATEAKAREFADNVEDVDITSVTFRGTYADGTTMTYTLGSGREPGTDHRHNDGEMGSDD